MKPRPASRDAGGDPLRRQVDLDAERGEHVGRAERDDRARLPCLATLTPAPATISAAAVEIVVGAGGIAPGADDVDGVRRRDDRRHLGAHGADRAGDLVRRLAAHPQRHQEAADLRGRRPARQQEVEGLRRLAAAEGPRCGAADEGLELVHHALPQVPAIPPRRDVEEVLQDAMAVLGADRSRVELHPVHRRAAMRHAHDDAVIRLRGDLQRVGQGVAVDDQRVVTRGLERPVDAAEHAAALVVDLRELAVHRQRRLGHGRAEHLSDRLVAEADAEERRPARRLGRSARSRCRRRCRGCRGRATARWRRARRPGPRPPSLHRCDAPCPRTRAGRYSARGSR